MASRPYLYSNSPYGAPAADEGPGPASSLRGGFTTGVTFQKVLETGGYVIGAFTRDENFNPWADMTGYEAYADRLVHAQSRQQIDWMKDQIDFNIREKKGIAPGIMGFAAQLIGSMADPVNLIPVPITRGMGFVRGGVVGAATGAGIAAITEPARIAADPTAEWNELAYSIGGATLFGAALGGLSGSMGRLPLSRQDFLKGQRGLDAFVTDLNDIEAANLARTFDAAEQNYDVVPGATGLLENGRYEPVKIEVVEVPLRQKEGSDGQLYHYDDSFGWVLEADRGRPDPRPVPQDILDGLGKPATETRNRMIVDEAALKVDFENGKTGLPDGEVRTAGEYVTYKQIEAVWKQRDPMKPDEAPDDFRQRIQDSALRDLKASRASLRASRKNALTWVLDKLNWSPAAKAIRLAGDDNIMGDLPMQIAGDYGWATRANEFGYKTPPSLLLRSVRHLGQYAEVKQALDTAYVQYAQRNSKAQGVTFMGENVTASLEGLKARGQQLRWQKVVTRKVFARMAGRAVSTKDDFMIDGIPVVPEAREAAKAWTRIAQKYDRDARDLHLFYDERALQRTAQKAALKIDELKASQAEWLWGETGQPEALVPAIKVGDEIFVGASHREAIASVLDAKGVDFKITSEMYGYVPRLNDSASVAMYGPISNPNKGIGWIFSLEPDRPRFSVKSKDFGGPYSVLGNGSYESYAANVPEHLQDKRITDQVSFVRHWRQEARSRLDRSLWQLADRILAEKLGISGQQNRKGYNGLTYIDPIFGREFFISAQASDFIQSLPAEYVQIVNDTINRVFPSGTVDLRHAATLTSEITNATPPQAMLDMYGMTLEQYQEALARGARTYGFMVPMPVENPITGMFRLEPIVRVAINRASGQQVLNTTWHELFHALKWTGRITRDEWDALVSEARARDWHNKLNPGHSLNDEEAIAHAVGLWAEDSTNPLVAIADEKTKGFFGRLLQSISDVWNKINGTKALPTWKEFLVKMDSGEIGRRSPKEWISDIHATLSGAQDPGLQHFTRSTQGFRTVDELISDRVDSLTPAQRRVYDRWQDQIDELEQSRKAAEMDLQTMRERPHMFLDQHGEPEAFFPRFWNHTAIAAERERFKALLTDWYRRTNINGAAERADKTIDNMLKSDGSEDMEPVGVPGLRHLNRRKLDMPNSFAIVDPEFGEISAADFFNTDLEAVSEAYIRGMGLKIEAARMFGDATLSEKTNQIKDHFRTQYVLPAVKRGASEKEIDALHERLDEYLGWIDIIKRQVMGGIKTRDPWTLDNRTARNLKNYQILTSMGKSLITSIPEAMRLPMVNGFRTAFGSIVDRALLDAEKIRPNVEFSRLTAETMDLVRNVHAARLAEGNTPDPSGGGSYIERLLERAVPGFLKLVGLTHWTVITKDFVMLASQHKIMDLVRNIDEGDNAFKLASLGISRLDARLLASMPVDQHGMLILPAVQNWTGADGMRARTLLLDAIHGEARRAIVTPGPADLPLAYSGVVYTRSQRIRLGQGKDVKPLIETDLITVPLQFMSYGLAASQKVLMSTVQGRDQAPFLGAFALFMLGMYSNYLKQPQTATMNKSAAEWMLEGYEASGVGAFWFSDLNQMIERYSRNAVGLRPMLGIDPRFGKTTGVGDYIDAAGPSIGTLGDVVLAFTDPELSATTRAQAIRRAVPYNNVLWWGGMVRDATTKAGMALE